MNWYLHSLLPSFIASPALLHVRPGSNRFVASGRILICLQGIHQESEGTKFDGQCLVQNCGVHCCSVELVPIQTGVQAYIISNSGADCPPQWLLSQIVWIEYDAGTSVYNNEMRA